MADVVRTLFPNIFSGLLVSLTSGMSFSLPSDTDIQSQQRGFTAGFDADTSRSLNERCVRSLKALFELIGQSDISDQMVMVGGWQQLLEVGFDQGVVLLAQAMTASAGDDLFKTVHYLVSQILRIQDCQAVPIIIFFGELLKAPCLSELGLTDMVINSLMRYLCWYDSSPVSQLLSIRALINIDFGARQRCWSVTDVLVSLLGNPENSDVFTRAVLSCLQKNILEAPAEMIRPFLNTILSRIQPLFGAGSEQVSVEALQTLEKLATFGESSDFQRQLHANIVPLLLHLDTKSEKTIQCCCAALQMIFSSTGSTKACSLVERYLEALGWS
ncbi:hypothetical protein chiPu_0005347 [Chiloscyllium punctatum]|uniref:Maestro/Maestro-like HEAT-repeats domain-containing protein n=1 Tax=Chiloscyllium punctatum TaxID=137246 RepID=A0A401S952_CHIPU|nr:hypothetical protein [Chiloscyllium punctatum]